ncbi:zinc finger protein on ecdysone puffs [Ischnura elegans]|uniref:zinc finger protein on ecdysone puffs n=1 Tax=Ischnura elegans TaxID=197161 RepID=UPI001ED87609|nr:zinc finger protein on ecdysone puffs [Ischnura elegans]
MSHHHSMRRNPRTNRPSFGGRSSGHVSPWEGGLVPGGGIGMGGGVGLGGSSHQQSNPNRMGGLLPTPVPQASSLLSQLSTHEAQLAIASNLLSTLLRPQSQQQQQQQQVAPLLNFSLGQLGGSSSPSPLPQLGMGMGQGHHHHQQHMAPSLMGRYQDGGGPLQRRRRMDNRRQEPYSKMGNRSRDSSHLHHATQSRHQGSKGGQTPERKQTGSQGNWHSGVGKGRTPDGKSSRTDKKEDKEPPSSSPPVALNESKQEESKPSEEDKTKKDDQSERADDDGKKAKKEKDMKMETMDDDDDGKMRGDDSPRASKFIGIPQSLLFCHVCQKHMWDEHSFENHLKGRAHQLMMTKLEDSYRIKVELMRHELKVAEQQREIELERMKRQGKKINTSREYCMMCDLQFFGNLLVHRKTVRHQKLKAFLHPRCIPCNKEFATRVEWDKHRLTPYHLKKAAESRKVGSDDDDFDLGDLVNSENFGDDEFDEKDIPVRTREEEEEEIVEIDKGKAKEEREDKEKADDGDADKNETPQNAESPHKMLKYNPDVPVGQKLLKQVNGYYCRLCRRFFLHEEHAFQLHCRTLSHFSNYSALLKAKARAAEARERKEAKEENEKKNNESQAEKRSGGKVGADTKRAKLQATPDEVKSEPQPESTVNSIKEELCTENGAIDEAEITEIPVESKDAVAEKKSKGSDKYDPLEADGDSDDDVGETPVEVKETELDEEELLEGGETDEQVAEPEVIDLEKDSQEVQECVEVKVERTVKVEAEDEEEEEPVPKGRGSPRGGTARRASLRARTRRRR